MNLLKIRPLIDRDIQLIEIWLKKEHVKKWYENPDDWLAEIKGRNAEFKFIKHFIALYKREPVGFCQYYKCEDAKELWYGTYSLEGTYSIDYLIGEENYLGKGLGKEMIKILVDTVFSLADSKRIIVQPEEDNQSSCGSLLANGFTFDTENKVYVRTK